MTVAVNPAKVRSTDMKFELAVIPVSDVARAKEFYAKLGWRFDAEFTNGSDFHIVQFTPPGSGASVIFGKNVTQATRKELLARGVKVSEAFHGSDGVHIGTDEPYLFGSVRVSGPDPQRRTYQSFASFSDPDGNGWVLQEVTNRLPGRVEGDTTFASVSDLAATLRRASAAHGEHEKLTGEHDVNWPDWYAEYIVSEQAGKPLPK
jgi:catechol 2,3-dioxygenase-like lactoylglutathione lyase family enzyme